MSFGRKILEKYGYKEGSGLGKNSDGIQAPIKASFKFDQAGLGGSDEQSTQNHWWERCFNEASNNLNVNTNNEKIDISLNDKEGVEITNKSYSLKKLKESGAKLQYGNFLKSATLLADVGKEKEIENHVTTETIEIKPFQALNDEELFKACDGRTAHKGARHGLNLSGKLQRIAEQEKLLMERLKKNKEGVFKQPENASPSKLLKKRPLIELNTSKDDSSDGDELPLNLESESTKKSKSERKKIKKSELKKINKIATKIDSIGLESPSKGVEDAEPETTLRERRKEKRRQKRELEEVVESSEAEAVVKKKCKTVLDDDDLMGEEDKKSRKKKKKRKNEDKTNNLVIPSSPEKLPQNSKVHVDTPMRKKKKKAKKNIAGMEMIEEVNGSYKRLLEDDFVMSDNQDAPVKPKKIKLNDPYEATGDDDDESDIIDAINSEHFQNMPFQNKASEVENLNFESSSKKNKKSKKKSKGFSTDDWEVKRNKKAEKVEKEKLKRLKNMERKELKREKKNLKKLAKKEHAAKTESLANEIDSLEFK